MRQFFVTCFLVLSFVPQTQAQYTECLRVKIFSSTNSILFKDRDIFVVHFQLSNCGHRDQLLDFYANLGYKEDEKCSIYFDMYKQGKDNEFAPYNFAKTDYQNMIDSNFMLHPRKIYTFYLPLLQLYTIKEPGKYRIQGFYRYKTNEGTVVQPSDFLYLDVK